MAQSRTQRIFSTTATTDITRQRTMSTRTTTTEFTQTTPVTIIDESTGCEYQKEISFKHHKTHISIQLDGIRAVLHSSDESPSTIQTIGSTLTTPIETMTPIIESDGAVNIDMTPVDDDAIEHEVP